MNVVAWRGLSWDDRDSLDRREAAEARRKLEVMAAAPEETADVRFRAWDRTTEGLRGPYL